MSIFWFKPISHAEVTNEFNAVHNATPANTCTGGGRDLADRFFRRGLRKKEAKDWAHGQGGPVVPLTGFYSVIGMEIDEASGSALLEALGYALRPGSDNCCPAALCASMFAHIA